MPAQKSGAATSSRLDALRERLRSLLGEEKLLSVNFSAALDDSFQPEETDIFEPPSGKIPGTQTPDPIRHPRIWGFIGSPGVSRATREGQHLFVNRRPVENRGLNYALLEGYHTALMKGRYPVCCLFLEIDPAAVDVNIHPAKREVKFHRESEIRKLVAQAVQETLLAFHAEPDPKSEVQSPKSSAQRRREKQPQPENRLTPNAPNFPDAIKAGTPATAAKIPLSNGHKRL